MLEISPPQFGAARAALGLLQRRRAREAVFEFGHFPRMERMRGVVIVEGRVDEEYPEYVRLEFEIFVFLVWN